ncbi:hypothetical protein [Paractinoplanes globisporus]|uniref:Uncharacterized protein n=1 Tax=Paractinoplanes globisporus TaxID=113565 RepID=A0ABW6WT28_9ACTN|nr:hypothetical protein [Actinoplanes globisporus]
MNSCRSDGWSFQSGSPANASIAAGMWPSRACRVTAAQSACRVTTRAPSSARTTGEISRRRS